MRKNLVITPLMVLLAAGAAFAQDTSTAVMTGRVTAAEDGRPLQGVRVLIESPALLGVRNAVTDANGQFRTPLLPNGDYTVTYTFNGYLTRRVTLRLIAGQTGSANARLSAIGAQEEVVEIIGRAAQVDKTDTIVQTSFDANTLEKIVGRSLNAVGALAPGLNTSDLTTQGTINIRGGTGKSTKLLLNGSSLTEMYGGYVYGNFSMPDLIESMAVIQSPINARYGNTDGGIISMVSARGSNTFTGTFRVTGLNRSYWSIHDHGYERRDGTLGISTVSTTDALNKSYYVSLQGPLWKDRITFTYGGRLYPTTYDARTSANVGDGTIWNTPYDRPDNAVGTFFQQRNPDLPGYGDVIRKPEMYVQNTPTSAFYRSTSSTYNQFSVYGQITPLHQVEYNYTQYTLTYKGAGHNWVYEDGPWNQEGQDQQFWNAAYKGVIGSSGVLEARVGRYYNSFWFGDQVNHWPIRSLVMRSRNPINPGGDINDFNNYYSNGLVGPMASSGSALLTNNTNFNPYPGFRNQLGNGQNVDFFDAGTNTSYVVNYQHILNTGLGTHIIDVGYQSDNYNWLKKAGGPPRFYDSPGRIAYDLTATDIWNAHGNPSAPASMYAGKFIVFNVPTARLSDVDPWAVERYQLNDIYYMNQSTGRLNAPYTDTGIQGLPRMLERFGPEGGDFDGNMSSYYINDLWSINDHHSVMVGVRFDNFKVSDETREFLSYSQPTFRFEYKWDIHGDQSRVVNASWAQFHSMQPVGLFRSLVTSRLGHNRYRFWDKGTAVPYLVDLEQVLDINNYGKVQLETFSGFSYAVESDWKAPISTEIQVGMRRNLSSGGSYKATFVYRTWENDFDFFPGELFTAPNGSTQIRRVLRNAEGYERKYTGVELEWDLPIHKRLSVGGSYTFNRLMSSVPSRTDEAGSNNTGDNPAMNLDFYWDSLVPGGRDAWRPSRLLNPEHYFKFYLLFDLTSGKVQSSLAFNGSYTSGVPYQDGFNWQYGFPYEYYPELMTNGAGSAAQHGGITSGGSAQFSDTVFVPINNISTYQDTWGLTARYMLTVPLVRKLSWFAIINISSPFNHRGLSDNFRPTGANTAIRPYNITGGGTASNVYNGVWRANDDFLSLYQVRQGGRSISVETGLRF